MRLQACLNGGKSARDHPAVPLTPQALARDAAAARRAGAECLHFHPRDAQGRESLASADVARAYVVGNFILGLLLAIASCLCFWSWHLPYWLLVGFFSGFLSLVPYVRLPLALIPAMASTLMTYDAITPYLLIGATVAFLHLLALNLLYPSIVGGRVHLNPLAVTIALMFWGTIWGALGLILAIPLTAGAKAVFDNVEALKPYGHLLGD